MVVSSSYDIVLQHNWETNNHLADPQVDMINLRNCGEHNFLFLKRWMREGKS